MKGVARERGDAAAFGGLPFSVSSDSWMALRPHGSCRRSVSCVVCCWKDLSFFATEP